jgi:hypothetical protein
LPLGYAEGKKGSKVILIVISNDLKSAKCHHKAAPRVSFHGEW